MTYAKALYSLQLAVRVININNKTPNMPAHGITTPVVACGWSPSSSPRSCLFTAIRDLAFALLLLSTLGGCTTLHVFGADGTHTTTQRFPGFVDIKFDSQSGALGYIRSSIGVGASSDGITLGYGRTAAVRITNPEACQAVVLVTNAEAAQEVHRLLAELGAKGQGLCIERKGEPK